MNAAGIQRVGVHIPRYRLSRADIAATWGGRSSPGARAVANWDEDALTMATEAASRCLADVDRSTVDVLLVCSTTLPYAEKQSAATVAAALDLRPDVLTVDVCSSPRAATQAVRLGLYALAAGARRVLVACADQRDAPAGSRLESQLGDGAVALLLGPDAPVTLEPLHEESSAAVDTWRQAGERFIRQADERFVGKVLFERSVASALRAGLAQAPGADPSAGPARVAIGAPDHRSAVAAARAAGVGGGLVAGEAVYREAGQCGVATGLLNLLAALEDAPAGASVLLVSYGDGVDVLRATAQAEAPFGQPVACALARGRPLAYGAFLRFKQMVQEEPVVPSTSAVSLWRDAAYVLRWHGLRCNPCGAIQYPPRRVCWQCRAKDDFEEVPLPRHGVLFTFTVEHLYPVPDRQLITAVVDLANGARIFTQATDCEPDELEIGQPLGFGFRRVHSGGGFPHYFWKAIPAGL